MLQEEARGTAAASRSSAIRTSHHDSHPSTHDDDATPAHDDGSAYDDAASAYDDGSANDDAARYDASTATATYCH
jgi:hypothetical protein